MKLTNKNPVDYFDAQMLASLKQCDQDSKAPFDTFLAARQNSPSSGTSH
jgi:hypothetical protein